jgi:long-chain acyl-CoA synthetase
MSAVNSSACSSNVALLDHEYLAKFGIYTRQCCMDCRYTNADELQLAAVLARALKARDVIPGDRVLLMLPNIPEMTAMLQAIWTIGAVAVPVMPHWTAVEASHVLTGCGATAAVTVPELVPRLHEAARVAPALRHLLAFGECETPECEDVLSQLAAAQETKPVPRSAEAPALLLYTSGTTGLPKGSLLTHGNIRAAVESFYCHNPELAREPMIQALPFSHSFGLLMLLFANRSGLPSVLLPQFNPVKVFEAVERYRARYLPAVPTMLVQLLNHPDGRHYDLSSLKRISSGGASLPDRLRMDCEEAFGCRVDQGYGLSETFAVAATYTETAEYRAGSVGVPTPGVETRILNDRGQPLPPMQIGEIAISGANVCKGYWNDDETTQEAFRNGWLLTGDVGYRDEDGYLYITDRKKEVIIKGGENISPREIEDLLCTHPAVVEAAAIGMPDVVYGEDIWAFVQLRPGAEVEEEALRRHLAGSISKFKVPAHIIAQPVLPKTPVGKISKRRIRERLAADLMTAVTSLS